MADFEIDNRRLAEMAQDPGFPPPQQQYQPITSQMYPADIRYIRPSEQNANNPMYIESVLSQNLDPVITSRILSARGVDPGKIKALIDLQNSVRGYQDAPQAWNRRLLEATAKSSNQAAESFRDPSRAVRSFGVDMRGNEPYSPQRAQQESTAARTRWEVREDGQGNLWERDTTGRLPARPFMTGGQQAVKTKELPASELDALKDNAEQLSTVVKALGLMRGQTVEGQTGDTEATGWKGLLPNFFLQRLDAAGNPARREITNVGSLKIKQRSGGAVPVHEMARLRAYVPLESDTPDEVRGKLQSLAYEYGRMLQEELGAYKAANRRIPVALEKHVQDRIGMARGVASGRLKSNEALGGQPDPAELMQAIQAELDRRGGGTSVAGQ